MRHHFANVRAAALISLLLLSGGCLPQDRFVEIVRGTYLFWDGVSWDVLDAGKNTGSPGGLVIVKDVSSIAVIDGSYVTGRDKAGQLFLITVSVDDYDEVERFAGDAEWRAALERLNISAPDLRPPDEVTGIAAE